ncbi:MAG: hypothetical protein V3S45_01210 [Kiloniellales bacterium]
MRAVKLVVIGMGLLIVGGLMLLVYGVGTQMGKVGGGAAGFGEVALPMPDGCVIADSRVEAPHLVVRLDGLAERGCQQVVLIDLDTGRVVGRLRAVPTP